MPEIHNNRREVRVKNFNFTIIRNFVFYLKKLYMHIYVTRPFQDHVSI